MALFQNSTYKMRKQIVYGLAAVLVLSSCVSKKKFAAMEGKYKQSEADLSTARTQLAVCESERNKSKEEIDYLRGMNEKLSKNVSDMTQLSSKDAKNLEQSLESLREKDMHIKSLNEALTRKDSMTIALVTSLKSAIGNMDDQDIQINVDKGVVFVNLSDRFLFKSGSYNINSKAKDVLAKVAKIVESKPDMEVLVEGHTDNVSYSNGLLLDNWDLSVKRSTALVRMLQNDFKIDPAPSDVLKNSIILLNASVTGLKNSPIAVRPLLKDSFKVVISFPIEVFFT